MTVEADGQSVAVGFGVGVVAGDLYVQVAAVVDGLGDLDRVRAGSDGGADQPVRVSGDLGPHTDSRFGADRPATGVE